MIWFQDPNKHFRTHAGFALHAGRLLEQYFNLCAYKPEAERYDATLTLCVLQTLLANCVELFEEINKNLPDWFSDKVVDIPSRWSMRKSYFIEYTFPSELTYARLVRHLRDAVSHPTAGHSSSTFSTGYSTQNGHQGTIEGFRFVHAPLATRDGNPEKYPRKEVADQSAVRYRKNGVTSTQSGDGKWQLMRSGEIFNPRMVAIVPLDSLKKFTKELATILAHPAKNDWNGMERHDLDEIEPLFKRQVR